ncbi:MAG: hypothetical protein Roseis2KO_59040 [Roseivirga sp.]
MQIIKTYTDQETALSELTHLRQNSIEADLAQSHNNGVLNFQLEVAEKDLEAAQALLVEESLPTADEIPNFMADYTDEELKEIIINQSDYSSVMVDNARSSLLERNPDFDFTETDKAKETKFADRLHQERQGLRAQTIGIVAAYIFALLGGIVGLGAGWFIETGKTIAVDGKKYYTYDDYSRRHGARIKWIGIISMICWVLFGYFLKP